MRNISELVGIIKGINFDGVVNDREVSRLQIWVDRNRNLAYEPGQAELITLVDSIIEERIIDEDERTTLLAKVDDYLTDTSDESGYIYELNGIVEGMICDGEVNEAEIRKLSEWMQEFGTVVRSHEAGNELCSAIEKILADGIVTEEEQQLLLDLLSERISNSQLESKISFLCKLVRERKNIGVDLIDILDNERAMAEIHSRAEEQLMYAMASYSGFCPNSEIIVVSLVLIAMLEYDGNYYSSVRSTYLKAYGKYSEQKVEGLIRSILARYRKKNDSSSRIINVALENAIVPQTYLAAFFEFIYDIYKINFSFDLPRDLYEGFRFVFEGLRSNMLAEGDDISVNVTQKTYKLIVSTKQLILREDGIDSVIKLGIIVVKLINRRYRNEEEVRVFNPYLKIGYDSWEKQFSETLRGKREYNATYSELRSRWEPRFNMINRSVFIVPPYHQVSAKYDYTRLMVVVENNGEELYRNGECFVKEIMGGYQINPPRIEVNKPLGNLKYKLVCGDEVIYESRRKLFRECLVFNQDGQEINNNTDYEGPAYFCYSEENVSLQLLVAKDHYLVGYKLIRKGDAIGIGHEVFNFSSMVKPGIFGVLNENCFVQESESGTLYPVYKEINVVVFEADVSSQNFEIQINDKRKKLSELRYKTTVRGTIIKYVVDLDIKQSGMYTIEINQIAGGKKTRILRESFAYDNELNYSSERVEDRNYRIQAYSGLLPSEIDTVINLDDFGLDLIRFTYDEKEYCLLIPFELGVYRLNEGKWCSEQEDIWYEEVSFDTRLSLYDSECDGVEIYSEKGGLLEDSIAIQNKGVYKTIAIGFLNSYKSGNRYIKIVFSSQGRRKYTLFCYYKCVIDEESTEILFEENPRMISITPFFHGKNRVFIEVFNHSGEKVFVSKLLKSGQKQTLEEFNSFEKYTFNFHEKTPILMLRKNTLLYQRTQTFYARQDFVGRTFRVITADYQQFTKKGCEEIPFSLKDVFLTIEGRSSEDSFTGDISVKTANGVVSFREINPVEIEVCGEIVDDTMYVYMTNNGDGLLLDVPRRRILNSLQHPTAPDIFLYTLKMN